MKCQVLRRSLETLSRAPFILGDLSNNVTLEIRVHGGWGRVNLGEKCRDQSRGGGGKNIYSNIRGTCVASNLFSPRVLSGCMNFGLVIV